MNKQTYLHFKDKRSFYELGTCLGLVLLWAYGFYKNGLTYVFLGKLSFVSSLRYIAYPVISLVWGVGFSLFKKQKPSLNVIIEALICSLLVPPQFPLWLFFLVTSLYVVFKNILIKYMPHFSFLALYASVVFILTQVCSITYYNVVEQSTPFLYGTLDIFMGRGVGNYGTTSIFLLLILYGFLATNFYYKRELPIYILASYLVVSCVYFLGTGTPISFSFLFNDALFFGSIVFFLDNSISPVQRKMQILFGCAIGILSFLFARIHFPEGAYLAILIVNVFYNLYYYLFLKKHILCK